MRRHRPSLAPATTASTSPDKSHIAATASSLAPLEHADARVRIRTNGPMSFSSTSPVAVSGCESICSQTPLRSPSGSRLSWARSASVSNIPPVVPAMPSPTRRERTSSPAWAIASFAASRAIWLLRDQDGPSSGSGVFTSAARFERCPLVSNKVTGAIPRSPATSRLAEHDVP